MVERSIAGLFLGYRLFHLSALGQTAFTFILEELVSHGKQVYLLEG